MKSVKCPTCSRKVMKYGKTRAGVQRWFCKVCNLSFTNVYNDSTKLFQIFLNWLFSKKTQKDMPGQGRTFRRTTKRFWSLWPLPPKIDVSRDVVYVDGIYLSRNLCVLICCDNTHVLGWYVCRSENFRAWSNLMKRIAEPKVVISDGGTGFTKALKYVWPLASHQRCLFHAFCQVRRYITNAPKTMAGRDLLSIARNLFKVKTPEAACAWINELRNWRILYNTFLQEMTTDEYGNKRATHERLLKAENSLLKLVKQHTLFTFIEIADISVPNTNNRIEGGVNAQLKDMLRVHRGLSLERRLKAVYWWCYMHSPRPLSISEILKVMPTDKSISLIYQRFNEREKVDYSIPQWGDGLAWNELHRSTEFPTYWD